MAIGHDTVERLVTRRWSKVIPDHRRTEHGSCGPMSAARPHLRDGPSTPATKVGVLRAQLQKQEIGSEDAGRGMEHAHAEDIASELISIARCRELLGDEADGLSDHEVDLIRHHADAMAHIIVEMFLERPPRWSSRS